MPEPPPPARFATACFTPGGVARGAVLAWPLLLSTGAGGLAMGAACRQAGMSLPLATLFSAGVYSGTAQALALQLWSAVPPLLAILLAAGAVNLRYLVMGARLATLYPGLPWRRMLPGLAIYGDATWLIAAGEAERGRPDAGILFGASAVTVVGWVGGTIIGFGAAFSLAGAWAAAAAFIPLGFIVAYIPDQWRGRGTALPWAASAAVALLALPFLAAHWAMLAGGAAGTAVAVLRDDG
jgi:predicted branched-subunit amino acid permease